MPSALSLFKDLPTRTKTLACLVFAITNLAFAGLYLATWRHYEAPDYQRWVQVQGKVTSEGSVWKPDSSLVQFGARFQLPGVAQPQRRPAYADRQAFAQAGLRIGTPVMLMIEVRPDGAILRELATLDGRVLFDDSLFHHVVAASNDAGLYAIVAGVVMALLGLIGAALLWFRRPADGAVINADPP